jgi:quinol-cytochrome oxidoreductase complex cytochrome b subunit
MLFGNVLVAFMILVIVLSIAGFLASPETNASSAIALIIISLILIALIKVPKKHYNPAPYRVRV